MLGLFGVWDEFLCWVCLGFGMSFCAGGWGVLGFLCGEVITG